MAKLHLIKLSVGSKNVESMSDWQATRRAQTEDGLPRHITRMWPRRADEVLDGGSLYWVMKGVIRCRQKLIGIEPFTDNEGIGRCRLVLDKEIVPTRRQERRPFQGWRYLKPQDAPADLKSSTVNDVPPELGLALKEAGVW